MKVTAFLGFSRRSERLNTFMMFCRCGSLFCRWNQEGDLTGCCPERTSPEYRWHLWLCQGPVVPCILEHCIPLRIEITKAPTVHIYLALSRLIMYGSCLPPTDVNQVSHHSHIPFLSLWVLSMTVVILNFYSCEIIHDLSLLLRAYMWKLVGICVL